MRTMYIRDSVQEDGMFWWNNELGLISLKCDVCLFSWRPLVEGTNCLVTEVDN